MVCEKIICPKCHTVLNKPPQLVVASEVSAGGGNIFGFASSDTLPCAVCGHAIDVQKIIKGEYDATKPMSWPQTIITWIVILGIIVFLLHSCT